MAKNIKQYLPRSSINRDIIIAIEELAREKNLSFGNTLEMLLYESATFTRKIENKWG